MLPTTLGMAHVYDDAGNQITKGSGMPVQSARRILDCYRGRRPYGSLTEQEMAGAIPAKEPYMDASSRITTSGHTVADLKANFHDIFGGDIMQPRELPDGKLFAFSTATALRQWVSAHNLGSRLHWLPGRRILSPTGSLYATLRPQVQAVPDSTRILCSILGQEVALLHHATTEEIESLRTHARLSSGAANGQAELQAGEAVVEPHSFARHMNHGRDHGRAKGTYAPVPLQLGPYHFGYLHLPWELGAHDKVQGGGVMSMIKEVGPLFF